MNGLRTVKRCGLERMPWIHRISTSAGGSFEKPIRGSQTMDSRRLKLPLRKERSVFPGSFFLLWVGPAGRASCAKNSAQGPYPPSARFAFSGTLARLMVGSLDSLLLLGLSILQRLRRGAHDETFRRSPSTRNLTEATGGDARDLWALCARVEPISCAIYPFCNSPRESADDCDAEIVKACRSGKESHKRNGSRPRSTRIARGTL